MSEMSLPDTRLVNLNVVLEEIPPSFPLLGESEWTYLMRRSMQEIIPGLFLGPYAAATKSRILELGQNGVTHIICVRNADEAQLIKPNFPYQLEYLTLEMNDSPYQNIIQFFPIVKAFINHAFSIGGKVLIHGVTGISRSAALVMAYIMESFQLTWRQAYTVVRLRRLCVSPNDGFVQQLKGFEPMYKAKNTMIQNFTPTLSCKRRFDEI